MVIRRMPGELTCYAGCSRVRSQTRVADVWLRFHPYEITLVLFNKLVKKFPHGCVTHVAVINHNAIHVFRKANRSMDLNLKWEIRFLCHSVKLYNVSTLGRCTIGPHTLVLSLNSIFCFKAENVQDQTLPQDAHITWKFSCTVCCS